MTAVPVAPSRLSTRVEAHALAAAVRVAVRWFPLRRVASALGAAPRTRGVSPESVAGCLDAASTAAARLAHPTCLYESLVAFGLLSRRGYAVRLYIGAKRSPDLESHAWVTVDGRPCDPDATTGFTAIWQVAPGAPR